jgi:hypothetical protein
MNGWLEAAVLAYPRDVREGDRDLLLGMALDMVEGGSPVRCEVAGLVAGGMRMRVGRRRAGRAPWGEALRRAGIPIATGFLALTIACTLSALRGPGHLGWVGWWWATAIGGALCTVAGLAFGLRRPAVLGALVLLGLCLLDLRNGSRGLIVVWDVHHGSAGDSFGLGLDFTALGTCGLGAIVLLAAGLGVDGRREHGVRATAWALAAAAALVAVAGLLSFDLWPLHDRADAFAEGLNASAAAVIVAAGSLVALVSVVVCRGAQRLAAALMVVGLSPAMILGVQANLPARETLVLGPLYLLALVALAVVSLRALVLSTLPAAD